MKLVYLFTVVGIAIALIAQRPCSVLEERDALRFNSDGALSYSPHSGYRKIPRTGYGRFDDTGAMAWYHDPIVEH